MKSFLIEFKTISGWTRGISDNPLYQSHDSTGMVDIPVFKTDLVLVTAENYQQAIDKIRDMFQGADHFVNKTIL